MQDHLDSSGTDGDAVLAFMQSLPPAPRIRNDFSELGIQAPDMGAAMSLSDNLDNVSVISATAAVQVQNTQVHQHVYFLLYIKLYIIPTSQP